MLDISKFCDLCLYECGREKCIADKEICFSVKPYHLFHYVLFGKGFYELDGITYELRKGAIFYIPPNIQPKYYPDKKDPWTYTWVAFGGSYADKFLYLCKIMRSNPIFYDTKEYKLFKYFIELSDSYATKGILDLKSLGLMYELFGEMIIIGNHAEASALSVKDGHIKEAKEFIMYNYQFKISIKDIADSLNITSNYLSNIFSERLGYSPKQYLIKYRMQKAISFLSAGGYKICEVAKMVGYDNQLHFSTEFRRINGLSPTDYIKRLQIRL